MEETGECFFRGSPEIRLAEVGVGIGMTGADYSFCGTAFKA